MNGDLVESDGGEGERTKETKASDQCTGLFWFDYKIRMLGQPRKVWQMTRMLTMIMNKS